MQRDAMTEEGKSKRGRHWAITTWPESLSDAAREAHFDLVVTKLDGMVKYACAGFEECPETKRAHCHWYLAFAKQVRFGRLKTLLPQGAHIERVVAFNNYREYVKKEGVFFEWGEWRNPAGGKNATQLLYEAACTAISDEKKCVNELILEQPQLARFARGLDRIASAVAQRSADRNGFRQVEVHVYVGTGGSGKTRRVFEDNPSVYTVNGNCNGGTIWFDGYTPYERKWGDDGERSLTAILFDDFYGQLRWEDWLRYCDGHPLQLQVKGSFAFAQYTRVYFTSNKCPCQWWPNSTIWRWELPEFQRRITSIVRFGGYECDHEAERLRRTRSLVE